jgi:hypothetical protein
MLINSTDWLDINGTDYGARDITAMSCSTGAGKTGTIKVWGVVPLGICGQTAQGTPCNYSLVGVSPNVVRMGAGDTIAMIAFSNVSNKAVIGSIFIVGE